MLLGVFVGVTVFDGVIVGETLTVGVMPVVYDVELPPQPGQSETEVIVCVLVCVFVVVGEGVLVGV